MGSFTDILEEIGVPYDGPKFDNLARNMEAHFTGKNLKVVKGDPFPRHPTAELIWRAFIACRDFTSVLVGLFYGGSL